MKESTLVKWLGKSNNFLLKRGLALIAVLSFFPIKSSINDIKTLREHFDYRPVTEEAYNGREYSKIARNAGLKLGLGLTGIVYPSLIGVFLFKRKDE